MLIVKPVRHFYIFGWKNYPEVKSEEKNHFFIAKVLPSLTCDINTCQANCKASGATSGICQVERNGQLKCMCSYNPLPCDADTCRNGCIAGGATGGICQVERNGDVTCMCSYNPV